MLEMIGLRGRRGVVRQVRVAGSLPADVVTVSVKVPVASRRANFRHGVR